MSIPSDFSSEWLEEVAKRANANPDFRTAARWFDSWIQLKMGPQTLSFKVFMGEIIKVVPGAVPFGADFALIGDDQTWRTLISSTKNMLRELMTNASLRMEGNLFECMRANKLLNIVVQTAREVGLP
ncbi:MAG: hypothetical protein ACLQME_17820 [Alphaproteobacteria bacterium]